MRLLMHVPQVCGTVVVNEVEDPETAGQALSRPSSTARGSDAGSAAAKPSGAVTALNQKLDPASEAAADVAPTYSHCAYAPQPAGHPCNAAHSRGAASGGDAKAAGLGAPPFVCGGGSLRGLCVPLPRQLTLPTAAHAAEPGEPLAPLTGPAAAPQPATGAALGVAAAATLSMASAATAAGGAAAGSGARAAPSAARARAAAVWEALWADQEGCAHYTCDKGLCSEPVSGAQVLGTSAWCTLCACIVMCSQRHRHPVRPASHPRRVAPQVPVHDGEPCGSKAAAAAVNGSEPAGATPGAAMGGVEEGVCSERVCRGGVCVSEPLPDYTVRAVLSGACAVLSRAELCGS
jgi:hypothetical protein